MLSFFRSVKPRKLLQVVGGFLLSFLVLGDDCPSHSGGGTETPVAPALTEVTATASTDDEIWVINAAEVSSDGIKWHTPAGMTYSIRKGRYPDGLFMGEIQRRAIQNLIDVFGAFGIAVDLGATLIVNGATVASLKGIGDVATEITALKQAADPASLTMSFIGGFEAMRTKIQGYDHCLVLGPGDQVTFTIPNDSEERPAMVSISYTVLDWAAISQEPITIWPYPQCTTTPVFHLPPMTFEAWVKNPSPTFFGQYWSYVAGPAGGLSQKWAMLNLDTNSTAWNALVCDTSPSLSDLRAKYVTSSVVSVDRADNATEVSLALPPGPGPPPALADFAVTPNKHGEREDLAAAIRSELGVNYRLADWNDILPYRSRIDEWIAAVAIQVGEDKSLLVSRDGQRFVDGQRHYYVSRFDHAKPSYYFAHDQIDNNHLCLGSWYGLSFQVLAVKE